MTMLNSSISAVTLITRVVDEPQILRPYDARETSTVAEAARVAGRPERTIREWCHAHSLGRKIGGQWAVSKVAFAMWLNGDYRALQAYLAGDRSSALVVSYYHSCGVPVPRWPRLTNGEVA